MQIFAIALVDLFAEDEADNVGILLDGAGFAKIAQLRAVIAGARFGRAAELREHQEGQSQFLRQQLQSAREGADFLVAIFDAAAAAHELQVVDHDQAEAVLGFEAAQFGVHVHQIHAGRIVDVERRLHQFGGG